MALLVEDHDMAQPLWNEASTDGPARLQEVLDTCW